MRETLKDLYSPLFIESFAGRVKEAYSSFDQPKFIGLIHDETWAEEEFKQRIRHVAKALTETLPSSYEEALRILYAIAPECRGIEYLFIPDFVELNGRSDFDRSMEALAFFTRFSTAEFAVRPFIIEDQERMLGQMEEWARSDNEHLRRLASEGTRPRLPWAPQLPELIRDPRPVLPILEKLKADPSLYVRKSVANHLNDISKDHPELVLDLARQWIGTDPLTDWIVKHACRTLLRKGDARALALFGYEQMSGIAVDSLNIATPVVSVGGELEFSFELVNGSSDTPRLRIDYEIGYMKANGKQAPKRYKCSDKPYAPGHWKVGKKHSFKVISTRRFYPGEHSLHILVNGERMASGTFVLEERKE